MFFQKNGTYGLKQLKNSIDKQTYDTLLASHLDKMISSSTVEETLKGNTFRKRLEDMGDDMLKQMFDSPEHLQDVMDVAKMGDLIQAAPSGASKPMVAVGLLQAGTLVDALQRVASGQTPRKGTSIILAGPALIGRVLARPTGAKWLSVGFKSNNPNFWSNVPAPIVRIIREASIPPEQLQKQNQINRSLRIQN
jgi:hypothetical protein